MEKIYSLNAYGEDHKIILGKTTYANNNTLAVLMIEVCDDGHEENFAVLTVNLAESGFMCDASSLAFIDINNLRYLNIKDWCVDNNICTFPGITTCSGFVKDYPLALFTDEAVAGMRKL